jgi:hypothetical protein
MFLLLGLLSLPGQADVVVYFGNDVLPSDARAIFSTDWIPGIQCDTPVVSGIVGLNYVAQLFLQDGAARYPIGEPASFRAVSQTDPLAGTWIGGMRTIEGVPADATVNLVVRAWDARFFSYEAAVFSGGLAGESLMFSYRNALSDPPLVSDTYMVNFRGVELPSWPGGGPPCIPEPETWALLIAGAALVVAGRRG